MSNSQVIFNLVQVYRHIFSSCLHIMSICSTIIFLTQKDPLNNTNFCVNLKKKLPMFSALLHKAPIQRHF